MRITAVASSAVLFAFAALCTTSGASASGVVAHSACVDVFQDLADPAPLFCQISDEDVPLGQTDAGTVDFIVYHAVSSIQWFRLLLGWF